MTKKRRQHAPEQIIRKLDEGHRPPEGNSCKGSSQLQSGVV